MKINSFEIENVKRVRTVAYEPSPDGLTLIGGKNSQGKTSVLDSIAWALGGNKFAPDSPQRDDSSAPPHIKVALDNGLVVERKGKNSDLTVTDPSGKRFGQKLLDSFVSQLALDLPKFMNANDKEKADVLLKVIGVGDQLQAIDQEYQGLYNKRQAFYSLMTSKQAYAAELPEYPDAPEQPVSALDLIQQNAEILARNGENQKKRDKVAQLFETKALLTEKYNVKARQYADLARDLEQLAGQLQHIDDDIDVAKKTAEQLIDESTDEIQAKIAHIDEINEHVRANQAKTAAQIEADLMSRQYDQMSAEIDELREKRRALLEGANLPLPNLSVEGGCLTYKGHKWGDMSGSDQLIVAASIIRKLNPQCQFILMDKLEQMDLDTLNSFNTWLKAQGLQVIATRVSTGNECQIIIEDGLIKPEEPVYAAPLKDWRTI